ncbi:hypothetical protein AVEN_152462-1 [Araneus ventricosus]|uniref:Small VCP/p97-interacting protein n=1 Tax=Araneus ventricosus TaxID=182803 RepID=A0A4Y2MTM9_ARAVE|nr:hypothetical protein AVEN_152462-1 [Araneus ventricosus]
MGFCLSCCKSSEPEYISPSEDERRQKMTEAAERRLHEQERRGLKTDASVQRVERAKERSMVADEAREHSNADGPLRWQVT